MRLSTPYFLLFTLGIATGLVLAGCQNKPAPKPSVDDDEDMETTDSTFDPGDILDSDDDETSSGGGISEADKQALQNALNAAKAVEPDGDDGGISAALQAELKRLMEEERQGKDVAVKKMALAGKMLEECAGRIAKFSPIPGQPLMGTWNGGGACGVSFEVSGEGQGGKYKVAGGTNGTLTADTKGAGGIQANPFSGNVSDHSVNGKSGSGSLTHPTFHRSKAGTAPCNVAVSLQKPKSPIPENYKKGMEQAGKCFRQTLILMSPVMDRLFKNLDPAVSQMLQMQFLGIKTK